MSNQKIVLVEVNDPPFTSNEIDNDRKLGDYYSEFIRTPLTEHLAEVFEQHGLNCPHEAFELGFITRGQWLLSTVETFYGEVTNGGVTQFFFNCWEIRSDVVIALEFLDQSDLKSLYQSILVQTEKELFSEYGVDPDSQDFSRVVFCGENREAIWEIVRERVKKSGIDDHFVMKWDEGLRKLRWPPELWSQQMIARAVEYIESHPSEFQKLQS